MVDGGDEALELINGDSFDMAIVDMGLEDINPHAMVRDIRPASASIRTTLMPLAGQEVLDEVKGVEISGVLPKFFFVDDPCAIGGQAMGWGDETIPAAAAVSPEPHVAAPLAEELGSEGTSVDSSGTAPADATPGGERRMLAGGGPRRGGGRKRSRA